jgi:hypothetical protein
LSCACPESSTFIITPKKRSQRYNLFIMDHLRIDWHRKPHQSIVISELV